MKIYISGLYSGTNPQPGVGIARSLRTAYPQAKLIGVEYSNRCSGIHWRDFDEIWLQRPWDELNLTAHAEEIKKVLDSGALWISSIDLEILWLARIFPDGHPNLLTPPESALARVEKPAVPAHEGLPVRIPSFVTTEISDWDLHAFCREHDWKVWLKGPYYEAVRARSWAEFEEKRHLLSNAWATEKLFLQAHASGYEESVTLSAYRGELLDCVRMRKRDLTELSKTWAGDISEVEEEFLTPLREIVRRINWTGGAELEMVRDTGNQLWLIEWNPRFPAWIHGATITGRNLPAALVFLTMHKDETMFNSAMELNVKGYVLKENAGTDITECIKTVAAGRRYITPSLSDYLFSRRRQNAGSADRSGTINSLTKTERRILRLIAEEKTSREIGEILFIHPRTVDNHRTNICAKLNLHGTNSLLRFALTHKSELSD